MDLVKVTIRLHKGDKERLDAYFPHLGYNAVIRVIVRKALKALDARYMADTFTDIEGGVEIDVQRLSEDMI